MVLGAGLFGWFANWLYHKIGELDRRWSHLYRGGTYVVDSRSTN
jgi:hypothetical protein